MGKALKVFLADDSPSDVKLFRQALATCKRQISLQTVSDGDEASRVLSELPPAEHPDLCILDLNLPKKCGREVLQEIRANPLLAKVPTVIFTSSISTKDVDHCRANRANWYVQKPTDVEDFFQTVHYIIEHWTEVASSSRIIGSHVAGVPYEDEFFLQGHFDVTPDGS